MAVIKAVSSKAGIGHAIDYVTKKEKTEEKLVSGLHCEPETVKEEMQATKELWGKTDGRTYKHYVQSYHEDEKITPEQAHKNAVELAEHTKAWKGHFLIQGTFQDDGHHIPHNGIDIRSILDRYIVLFQVVVHHFPKGCFLWGILFPCHKINLQTDKSILHQFEGLHKLWDTPNYETY